MAAGRRYSRAQVVALAGASLVAVGGWVGYRWLAGLPFGTVKYVAYGQTSTGWSWVCACIAAVATMVAAGLLVALLRGIIRRRWLRIAVGVMSLIAGVAGALWMGLLCLVALLGAGLEGTQTLVSTEDGTTLMITQDGFDGDVVNLYEPAQGWQWVRLPEMGKVDPREGPCTLRRLDASTLSLTCGATSQELARR